MWYLNGKKVVPGNIIELLTPVGLAHWIMGDGSSQNTGLHLSVYAFTTVEVKLLMNVLKEKFDLKCSIHKLSSIGGKPRI
jgi:LAGLIDADG DNA endonuclease family